MWGMAKYRVRMLVDAVQWMGDNLNDVAPIFEGERFSVSYTPNTASRCLTFESDDIDAGPTNVSVGEWIVCDSGRLLVFKPADFALRFERLVADLETPERSSKLPPDPAIVR
jgi:hypothetical protein